MTMEIIRCAMAIDKLCRKSRFGFCNAEEKEVETCPYATAVRQLATLLLEKSKEDSESK